MFAKFYTGATITPDNLLKPNYYEALPIIHTSMNVAADSIANVYGSPYAKQKAVVKPKAAFPKIKIYYNDEQKTAN
ncbi:MAG: hypothetical protein NTX50_04805 [Candidatus Sumerlaeota bacterium]|nr:hypothetical protein [Candidatus Sumerlaeota bacterium]